MVNQRNWGATIFFSVWCALTTHDYTTPRPARAGVTDDAAGVRRSIEHIERIIDTYGRSHFGFGVQ